jgi:hypothetical protein
MSIVENVYVRRFVGAMALDAATYEDVEADRGAIIQACATVILSSVAAGIGTFGGADGGLGRIGFFSAVALAGWGAWALVTFEVGARILPGAQTHADVGELLRTLGFAAAPGVFQIFGALPGATLPVFVVTQLWMLLAMIVAVRQALDYASTGRAVAVCALGWTLAVTIALGAGFLFGTPVF